jgi:arginine exporter protein ArgO
VEAFLAGLLAGLGVAVPLGAVGVLLVQEGVTRGWRPAAAGATGVALVDGAYALVAVVAGTAISSALAGRERAIQVVGAVVLLAVGAKRTTPPRSSRLLRRCCGASSR